MAEALYKHEIIRKILSDGKVEKPYTWYDEEWNIPCKMMTDYEKNTAEGLYCIDDKTTSIMDRVISHIDKNSFHYDVGFYSRGIKAKYGLPLAKFIFIFQSTGEGEENNIRIKVVEGCQLEACEIETNRVVREIVPRLRAWQDDQTKAPQYRDIIDKIWLPEVTAETWEVSPWFDRKIAENIQEEK